MDCHPPVRLTSPCRPVPRLRLLSPCRRDSSVSRSPGTARRGANGQDPLGKELRGWGSLFTVVGVVRNSTHTFVNESPEPMVYMSFFQVGYETMVQVETEGNPADLAPAVQNAIHEIDPQLPVFDVRSMRESTQMASSFAVIQST